MKCIIVDDEEMSRMNLERLCSRIDGIEVVSICEDGIKAISELEKHAVDLLFLDIEMPDLTGIEMVKSLSNLPQIIFTTSRTEFALEAFEYDVTDYLSKPITLPRFIKAVNKAKARLQKGETPAEEKDLYIRTKGKLLKLQYKIRQFKETLRNPNHPELLAMQNQESQLRKMISGSTQDRGGIVDSAPKWVR